MSESKVMGNDYYLIVGMGSTGLSIARHLSKSRHAFHFFDTRSAVASSADLQVMFPFAKQYFGRIDKHILLGAKEIYISPGVSRDEPVIVDALAQGKSVVGDVELFIREAKKPIVGITGSNGKSTVTTLVGLAAKHQGITAGIGGNIGTPSLELLDTEVDLYILELSSFQLESMCSQKLDVACILNVSEDHMDRYNSFDAYVAAKQRIFSNAKNLVFNLSDALTFPNDSEIGKRFGFGLGNDLNARAEVLFEWDAHVSELKKGNETLIKKSEIRCKGMHNIENALALFAIAEAAGLERNACQQALKSFGGLPHRCEILAEMDGVTFINDSKATNVGAASAAVRGLAPDFKGLLLIVGGEGKGADFSSLAKCIDDNVRVLISIGKDGGAIARLTTAKTNIVSAKNMNDAVHAAFKLAQPGEAVLLSPACASFDMFENFEVRGEVFSHCVEKLAGLDEAS